MNDSSLPIEEWKSKRNARANENIRLIFETLEDESRERGALLLQSKNKKNFSYKLDKIYNDQGRRLLKILDNQECLDLV